MAGNQVLGHAHRTPYAAHLVLEQPFQRLAELQVHLLGQTAHVVVALDNLARDVQRLDTVGVDSALRQPFRVGNLLRLGVKDLHEVATDNLALLLRLANACQIAEETLARIHANHVQPEALVVAHHILKLVLAEHTVVHEDTGQLVAYRFVEQYRHHRRVHAARQTEDNAVAAYLLAQLLHRAFHKRICAPFLLAAAHIYHEVLQQQRALQRVEHLGVELCAEHGHRLGNVISSVLHRLGGSHHMRPFGQAGDAVAVRHPHLRMRLKTAEQRAGSVHKLQVLAPVLARACALHLPAIDMAHVLRTVADTQDGQTTANPAQVHMKSIVGIHA